MKPMHAIVAVCAAGMLIGGPLAMAEAAPQEASPQAADPRAGDPAFEQANRLLKAVESLLQETARNRHTAKRMPSKRDFVLPPIWTETREDREAKIRTLLDAVLGIVTDVPIVKVQERLEKHRQAIRDIEDQIARLREKQITAPKDALLPGVLTDTVKSLGEEISDLKTRIEENKAEIQKAKSEIHAALARSGIDMAPDQLDLLLDSVLSDDLVKLVAAFNAARKIDAQLGKLVTATGDNLNAARKYFAMHAALFAMLVHAQNALIGKIDRVYLPRLQAIETDIKVTAKETVRLLRGKNRPDQRRALEANLKSQQFAKRVAVYYRGYLNTQREQLVKARRRSLRDLRIADNTYETVEASFQLRALIKDAASSFEAIQKLDAPGFEQIFQNKELRREFENLTRKLDVPTS